MNRKDEDDTERGLISRIITGVIIFVVVAIAIKFGVEAILSVKVPLIIIAVISGIVVIGVKAYKDWRDRNDY